MDFRDTKAIYLQIVDYIDEKILTDIWKEGERIPSVRELGGDLEVNPNTVMRAFDFLQNMEIISNKRGVGYFVTEGAKQKIFAYKRDEFLKKELPLFFKSISLLNIEIEEIEKMYNIFKSNLEK